MKYLFFGPLFFIYSFIFGQIRPQEYLIDKQLKTCLDSMENQSTVGMIGCTENALNSWDIEMNKYYKLLSDTLLSANEKQRLKSAQKKWIEFRDLEFSFIEIAYSNLQGSMWSVVMSGKKLEVVKQRALELKAYYDSLTLDY